MLYNGDIAYNQAHFNYSGVYVVSPESFGITTNFGGLKVLGVIVISPPSVNSTLVFVDSHSVITPSGIIENTETSSSMTFAMFDGYGSSEIGIINADAFAISSLDSQEIYSSGYIAISIDKNEAYAFSSAESIILEDNSAGTINVTIMSNA
jgi:hypothetical protein